MMRFFLWGTCCVMAAVGGVCSNPSTQTVGVIDANRYSGTISEEYQTIVGDDVPEPTTRRIPYAVTFNDDGLPLLGLVGYLFAGILGAGLVISILRSGKL